MTMNRVMGKNTCCILQIYATFPHYIITKEGCATRLILENELFLGNADGSFLDLLDKGAVLYIKVKDFRFHTYHGDRKVYKAVLVDWSKKKGRLLKNRSSIFSVGVQKVKDLLA